jgi:hypothetical protein
MPLVFPLPPLSTSGAHIISCFFAFTYVGSLYVFKNARLSFNSKLVRLQDGQLRQKAGDERWRDDPDVIKARLLAVCMSTLLSCLSVFWLVWHIVGDNKGVRGASQCTTHHNADPLSYRAIASRWRRRPLVSGSSYSMTIRFIHTS